MKKFIAKPRQSKSSICLHVHNELRKQYILPALVQPVCNNAGK